MGVNGVLLGEGSTKKLKLINRQTSVKSVSSAFSPFILEKTQKSLQLISPQLGNPHQNNLGIIYIFDFGMNCHSNELIVTALDASQVLYF